MSEQHTFKTRLIATTNGFDLHESTDRQRSVFATRTGEKDVLGSAWGPAADRTGNWFACLVGGDPRRVDNRQAAIDYITATREEVAR